MPNTHVNAEKGLGVFSLSNIRITMDTYLTPKNAEKFNCEKRHFKCSKKSEYDRHILTAKHIRITMDTYLTPKNAKPYVCECGCEYQSNGIV
jgi:hypothetical protein